MQGAGRKPPDLFRRNEHPAEVEDDAVELFEKVHSERTEIGLFGCGAEVGCDSHLFQGAGAVADREGYILQVVTRTSQNSAETSCGRFPLFPAAVDLFAVQGVVVRRKSRAGVARVEDHRDGVFSGDERVENILSRGGVVHQVSPACRCRFRSGGQEKETLFGAKLDLAGQTHEVGAEDGFDMADLVRSLVVVEDHEVGVADRDRSDLHGVGRGEFHESVAADTAHGNRIADDFEVVALGEFRRNEAGAAATRVEDEALGAAADRYVGIEVMDLFVRAVQRAFDRFASDGQRQPDFAVGFRERRARMSGHGLEPPLGRQGRSPLFLALSGSELGEQVGRLFVGAQLLQVADKHGEEPAEHRAFGIGEEFLLVVVEQRSDGIAALRQPVEMTAQRGFAEQPDEGRQFVADLRVACFEPEPLLGVDQSGGLFVGCRYGRLFLCRQGQGENEEEGEQQFFHSVLMVGIGFSGQRPQVVARRVLENAQVEFGDDGQHVIEYVGLNAFVRDPVHRVGEEVKLHREALFGGLQLPDEYHHVVIDPFVLLEIEVQVVSEDPDVGLVQSVDFVFTGGDVVLPVILLDPLLGPGDVIFQQVDALVSLQHFGCAETDAGHVDIDRALDAAPSRGTHSFPVLERVAHQQVGREGDDRVVPVADFDRVERDLLHRAVGAVLGHADPVADFEHVVGRQLDARYETQDAVAEDQHEDRGRSAQTGEEHRRRAVEKNREDEDDGDQEGDDLSGLHQALQRLAFPLLPAAHQLKYGFQQGIDEAQDGDDDRYLYQPRDQDDEAVLIGKGDGQHHHHQDRGDDVAQPPQDFVVEDDVVPRDFGLLDDASHDLQQQQADQEVQPYADGDDDGQDDPLVDAAGAVRRDSDVNEQLVDPTPDGLLQHKFFGSVFPRQGKVRAIVRDLHAKIVEPLPIFCKDSESREENGSLLSVFRSVSYLLQR